MMASLSPQTPQATYFHQQKEDSSHRLNLIACTAKMKTMFVRFKPIVNRQNPCPEKHINGEKSHSNFKNKKLTILLSTLRLAYRN